MQNNFLEVLEKQSKFNLMSMEKKKQVGGNQEEKREAYNDGNDTEESGEQNEVVATQSFIEKLFQKFETKMLEMRQDTDSKLEIQRREFDEEGAARLGEVVRRIGEEIEERDDRRDSEVRVLKEQNQEFGEILQKIAKENSERLFQLERNILRVSERTLEPESPLLNLADNSFRQNPIPISTQRTAERTAEPQPEDTIRGNQRVQLPEEQLRPHIVSGEESQSSIRRNSFYGRILVENNTLEDPDRRRLTVESEKHRQIIWKDETVDGFLEFLQKIYHFMKSYDQKVPNIFTHLSEDIQQLVTGLLFSQKSTRYKDMQDVYSANLTDIHDVAKVLFAPRDMIQFVDCLAESCAPYAVEMKQREYARARTELYSLRQNFEERFEFLAEGAVAVKRGDVILTLTFKAGGILRV